MVFEDDVQVFVVSVSQLRLRTEKVGVQAGESGQRVPIKFKKPKPLNLIS